MFAITRSADFRLYTSHLNTYRRLSTRPLQIMQRRFASTDTQIATSNPLALDKNNLRNFIIRVIPQG